MASKFTKKLILFLLLLGFFPAVADVVKPALIEISVNKKGQVDVEIRASIEALLTGINGKYKNTKDAPNADEYDELRKMQGEELTLEFDKFRRDFLQRVQLTDDDKNHIALNFKKVDIPEPGYTKVPRISVIKLEGTVDLSLTSLQWYYPMAFGDNAVRLRQVDAENNKWHWSEWQWLRKDEPSAAFSLTEIVARKPIYQTIDSYVVIGFEHILPKGLDHILFILGLFLFSVAFRPLLWQVTMFTIAHTITLGLAMNGVFNLPANIVEPLIALSIVYVGVENVFAHAFSRTLHNSRLILVFAFGLLHGLGFASVLADFGMPDDAFVTALISFNVGVELGQLAIILTAFLLLGLWFGNRQWYKKVVAIPASLLISLIAFYWFIERLEISI